MSVVQIYDKGNVFAPSVLDIDEKELIDRFLSGIKTIAAISLAIQYPTLASVAHSLVNSYKNVLAVSLATDYTYEGSEKAKEYLANPEAFAAAAPVQQESAGNDQGSAPAAEAPKEEEKEESDDDMQVLLFCFVDLAHFDAGASACSTKVPNSTGLDGGVGAKRLPAIPWRTRVQRQTKVMRCRREANLDPNFVVATRCSRLADRNRCISKVYGLREHSLSSCLPLTVARAELDRVAF
jgi:hypothetical protein